MSDEPTSNDTTRILLVIVAGALFLALICIVVLAALLLFRGLGGPGTETAASPFPPVTAVTQVVVTPLPTGVPPTLAVPTAGPSLPTATVIAPKGVNVRTGPGLEYTIIGVAAYGTTGEVVGRSQDATWWVVRVPGAPGGLGWVSAEFVRVENAGGVLVIPAPPTPTPVATATPTATPAPEVTFTADRTVINAGESATLTWSVSNVQAVYMYPVGAQFSNYPAVGEGSQQVQPFITTSYELLVFNRDGTQSAQRIEITVVNGLTTSRWLLQSYSTAESGQQMPVPSSQITARFGADGTLGGSAGCNSYSGGFQAYDQILLVGSLTSSQALCDMPEGVMEQEAVFLSLMQRAATMTINAGQLTIFDGTGQRLLVFLAG